MNYYIDREEVAQQGYEVNSPVWKHEELIDEFEHFTNPVPDYVHVLVRWPDETFTVFFDLSNNIFEVYRDLSSVGDPNQAEVVIVPVGNTPGDVFFSGYLDTESSEFVPFRKFQTFRC